MSGNPSTNLSLPYQYVSLDEIANKGKRPRDERRDGGGALLTYYLRSPLCVLSCGENTTEGRPLSAVRAIERRLFDPDKFDRPGTC